MISARDAQKLTNEANTKIFFDWLSSNLTEKIKSIASEGKSEIRISLNEIPGNFTYEKISEKLNEYGYIVKFEKGYDGTTQFDSWPDTVIISW